MEYKEDWLEAKQNIEAFWNGDDIGRPLAAVFAPRTTNSVVFPELQHGPWTGSLDSIPDSDTKAIERWWRDPEENLRRMLHWFENTYFGGECVPATYVNWGASAAAAFFGSRPTFNRRSAWYGRCIDNWDNWNWTFVKETNEWWNNILDIVKHLNSNAKGRYFVGMPEFGNAADNLSLMRGMDNLAMDCYDDPEAIERAINFMDTWWVRLHEELYQLTAHTNDEGGVLPWMSLWAPGRIDQLACDFSSILSPQMFRELFVPDIKKIGSWTEYGMYHLDGPDCIRNHLDTLLEIDCIKAIEFTPGAGFSPTLTEEYIPKYRKILESGKRLYLLANPDEVEPLCRLLSSKGLFLSTFAESREQADQTIENMYRWSRK
jgi:hypothetical protein